MDVISIGILGTFLKYHGPKELFPTVPGVHYKEYIMKTPKYRAFVDSVLMAAKKAQDQTVFDVPLKKALWDNRHVIFCQMFQLATFTMD